MTDFIRAEINGLTFRARSSSRANPSTPVMVALHGLTGDENAMGIFAPRVPPDFTLLFLRALYPYNLGGFSWIDNGFGAWPNLQDFHPAIQVLESFLASAHTIVPYDPAQLHLIGFSQGAALAFAFALTHPKGIQSIAGLSGFLPEHVKELEGTQVLLDVPIFIAHGTEDPLVPIHRAQRTVSYLESCGARVTYCEDHAGHKLSPGCFRALGRFYKGLL